MDNHVGRLLPAGAHIMSGLVCRVLDEIFRNAICDCSDVSCFQDLFHKSFLEVRVKMNC